VLVDCVSDRSRHFRYGHDSLAHVASLQETGPLGFWVFMTYHYSHASVGGSESFSYNFKFRFNHFWVGGYEQNCRWYGEFMNAVGAAPVPVVGRLLWLIFGLLAVLVKISIVGRLAAMTMGVCVLGGTGGSSNYSVATWSEDTGRVASHLL
jgi:hypothetical protein